MRFVQSKYANFHHWHYHTKTLMYTVPMIDLIMSIVSIYLGIPIRPNKSKPFHIRGVLLENSSLLSYLT